MRTQSERSARGVSPPPLPASAVGGGEGQPKERRGVSGCARCGGRPLCQTQVCALCASARLRSAWIAPGRGSPISTHHHHRLKPAVRLIFISPPPPLSLLRGILLCVGAFYCVVVPHLYVTLLCRISGFRSSSGPCLEMRQNDTGNNLLWEWHQFTIR